MASHGTLSTVDGDENAPTGLTRRRRRLSDTETEARMLRAATEMVNRTGLTVSLEHISFEEVIRSAGVSRSAVYRRWPYKDLFFSDLLRELAAAASARTLPEDVGAAELIRTVAADHLDRLETSEGRHELVLEILRRAALANFGFFHHSTAWRTHIALHATFLSLPAGELRDDVHAALTASEQEVVRQLAASYEHLATVLGYRLRPELDATYESMAELLDATMRGLVLTAPSLPDLATRRLRAAPFGAARTSEWSQAALGIAAIAMGFLEPDPTIEWTPERLAATRAELAATDWPRG